MSTYSTVSPTTSHHNSNKNNNKDNDNKNQIIATKISIIISEHNVVYGDDSDNANNTNNTNEERIVFNEIIRLKVEEDVTSKQILTSLGSVRGIKNNVKDRIKRFLAAREEENPREIKSKDAVSIRSNHIATTGAIPRSDELLELNYASLGNKKKIMIYTTSLGIIRKTKADCLYLTSVFRSMMLKTEERDIVSQYYHEEFKRKFPGASLPQVIINSFPVGGRKEIENLIETGEIKLLTKDIEKVVYSAKKCEACNGYGYLTCPVCLGSCKSRTVRIGKSRHVNNLKCTQCKEGMVRCEMCIDLISY